MECRNHAGVAATSQCVRCGGSFCGNCLVQVGGQSYCAGCKGQALVGQPVAESEEGTIPCREADEALKYALIGIVCFGIILEPYAISLAVQARRIIAANPRYGGSGKATAALVISIVVLVIWVIGIFARVGNTLSSM